MARSQDLDAPAHDKKSKVMQSEAEQVVVKGKGKESLGRDPWTLFGVDASAGSEKVSDVFSSLAVVKLGCGPPLAALPYC